MVYFGEEVGEKGMKEEGFSGKDGRTTIFDWWSIGSIRRLRKVIESGVYRTLDRKAITKAGLKADEADIFVRFAEALRFASSDKAIKNGTTYDLCYCNYSSDGFNKDRHFAFLRDYEEHTLLIVCNFSNHESSMKISIPAHAFEWMEIEQTDSLNTHTEIPVRIGAMDACVIQLI
jgi:hypothetical protein